MVNGVLEVAHKAINHVYLPISTFVPILSQLLFGGSFFWPHFCWLKVFLILHSCECIIWSLEKWIPSNTTSFPIFCNILWRLGVTKETPFHTLKIVSGFTTNTVTFWRYFLSATLIWLPSNPVWLKLNKNKVVLTLRRNWLKSYLAQEQACIYNPFWFLYTVSILYLMILCIQYAPSQCVNFPLKVGFTF